MNGWDLPEVVTVGGTPYRVNTDFRDVLDIIDHLTDPNDSEMERWYIAMAGWRAGGGGGGEVLGRRRGGGERWEEICGLVAAGGRWFCTRGR